MYLNYKLNEKLNYFAKVLYARYLGQSDSFRKGIAAANASDWDTYTRVNASAIRPRTPLPISAIIRVKDGEMTLSVSVEAIVHYCREIVIVDNASADRTWDIMQSLSAKYPDRVRIYRYDKSIPRAGVGYIDRVNRGEGSLAEFYNYCFSLGTERYLLKWDADNLAIPPFYTYFKAGIEADKDLVYFDGFDVMGVFSCTNEARLFKNSLDWKFEDFHFCEGLMIHGEQLEKAQLTRYYAPIPTFFHLKQLVR